MLSHDVLHDLWSLAGWTMVHFLWLGTIVAAFAFAGRLILRNAAPNVRYLFSLICLALITAMPFVTARLSRDNFLAPAARPSLPSSTTADANSPPLKRGAGGGNPFNANARTTTASPTPPIIELHTTSPNPPALDPRPSNIPAPRASLLTRLIPFLPWLWLIGTPLTFTLLFTGLIGTHRLSRASTPIATGPIADALARLTTSLRITRRVTVAMCERVAAPVLIGIVRPMILLPPAALTGWSPDEIEMVLLHELAHIRRYDNVVNLAQRIIESLLFFHPAVWLISTWVRREREACCDAAVVAHTQQPHAYAELLLNIAAHLSEPGHYFGDYDTSEPGRPRPRPFPLRRGRGRPGSLPVSSSMAAGPLRTRIRHILQLEDDPMLITPKSLAITLATLLAAATLAFVYLPKIGQAEQPKTEDAKYTEKTDSQKKAAAQDATQKNRKKLIMAVHNNVGNRDSFPANALYDPERRPLLSWRVYILPFLAEEKLYSEFHLGEPWNSEHNRKLIARMPTVFKNPRIDKPGFTNYLAVVGKECVFNGTPNGLRFQDVTDGTSKTIAIVEANPDLAVEWTKPQDWKFDRAAPTKGLGQLWGDGWYAAWVDGSVRRTENSEPADKIGIQFTRAGGEIESLKESVNPSGEGSAMGGGPGAGLDWYGKPVGPDSTRDWLGKRIANDEHATDDWPKGVAFPSPKEGEISIRAWRDLRIKVIPANKNEQAAKNASAIKVVGFPVPPTLNAPVFLLTLNDIDAKDFDQLDAALKAVKGQRPVVAKCVTTAEFGTVWIEVTLDGSDTPRHSISREPLYPPTPASAGKPNSKFPTLEDQKLADLAWKRLGLELEPIAGDDLQRVKALGYDGGLTVAGFGSFAASQDGSSLQLSVGDTLVGLHVWPTTNLKDVATVLNRDDLAEFNPLKIYVVRRPSPGMGGISTSDKGTVVTGRIYVPIGSDADQARLKDAEEATRQSLEVASLSFESSMKFKQEAQAKLAQASTNGDAAEAAQRAYDQAQKQYSEAKTALEDARLQFKEVFRQRYFGKRGDQSAPAANGELMTASPSNPPTTTRNTPSPWSSVPSTQYQRTVDRYNAGSSTTSPPPPTENSPPLHSVLINPSIAQATPPLAPRAAHLTPSSSPLAPQTSLRYDGKPFEEWRSVWKTELSTEKRIEAVKALAAFGRAGYGPEAAAAILDVAGEYDFFIMQGDDDPEGRLKNAVLNELAPRDRAPMLAPYWTPDLAARLKKEPKKWSMLAYWLLSQLNTNDESTLKIVRELASSDDHNVRSGALGALVLPARTSSDSARLDETARKLLDEALDSKAPEMVHAALGYLTYNPPLSGGMAEGQKLLYQPAPLPKLLFHSDEQIRRRARSLLPLLDDKATTNLVDQLTAILKDPARQRDRIEAIRALAVLGPKAKPAVELLEKLFVADKNEHRIPAAVALKSIVGEIDFNLLLNRTIAKELKITVTDTGLIMLPGHPDQKLFEAFTEALNSEQKLLMIPNRDQSGGGVF